MSTVVKIDLEGAVRPLGSGIDLGCYEFGPPSGFEKHAEVGIFIFPNPATNYIMIPANDNGSQVKAVIVMDAGGRQIQLPVESNQINVSNIVPGLYWLEIQWNGVERSQYKIWIKR